MVGKSGSAGENACGERKRGTAKAKVGRAPAGRQEAGLKPPVQRPLYKHLNALRAGELTRDAGPDCGSAPHINPACADIWHAGVCGAIAGMCAMQLIQVMARVHRTSAVPLRF